MLKEGRLDNLSEYVLIGLGCGHGTLWRFLEDPKDVSGSARTIEVHTGRYRGARISTVSIPGGGVYVEWIARILALKGFGVAIGIGFCGALSEELELGDAVIPIASARDEDTTDHYSTKKMPAVADFELVRLLLENSKRVGLRTHVGPIVTTSASLREDEDFISEWRRNRVLCVDCEVSVLYLISHMYGIRAGSILVVSDSLVKERSPINFPERVEGSFRRAIKAALESLKESWEVTSLKKC